MASISQRISSDNPSQVARRRRRGRVTPTGDEGLRRRIQALATRNTFLERIVEWVSRVMDDSLEDRKALFTENLALREDLRRARDDMKELSTRQADLTREAEAKFSEYENCLRDGRIQLGKTKDDLQKAVITLQNVIRKGFELEAELSEQEARAVERETCLERCTCQKSSR